MVKNTQKGNIDEKTGLVKSGKNKNRQRTLKRQKSPVCLGHIQLSVSPPNFPIEEGGAPTNLMSL